MCLLLDLTTDTHINIVFASNQSVVPGTIQLKLAPLSTRATLEGLEPVLSDGISYQIRLVVTEIKNPEITTVPVFTEVFMTASTSEGPGVVSHAKSNVTIYMLLNFYTTYTKSTPYY